MIKNDYCPSCASINFEKWDGDFLKCKNCEIVFRAFFPDDEELNDIYKDYYSAKNISQKQTNMVSDNTAIENQVKFIKRIVPPQGRVLDFGSGTGELVSLLKAEGFEVDGCEFSEGARHEADTKYGLDLYPTLDELKTNEYDLITAIEVIEHLAQPVDYIKRLRALLRDKGMLYLTTPNSNGLKARLKRSKWEEAEKPFHLLFFNFESIKHLLKDSGFNDVRYIKYSAMTTKSRKKVFIHRILQSFNLYGGLRVIGVK